MKKHLFFLFVCASLLGFSQETKLSPPEASFSAIIVTDMEVAARWYTDVLGFKILNETQNVDMGFQQKNLKHGGVHIELIEIKGTLSPETLLEGHPKRSRISGFFKFGMKVSDLDAWVKHLEAKEANIHGNVVTDPVSGKQMVIVKDPDGNRIQLFEK
ncbi:VOC family protein [Aureisphaera galaxeae]|uniref:VOC family protein n=1 Tax=Aureisphaera galaxeae TaxID=1538023 RepID=UPI0023505975|nr:VOC family protein [Aureisphaera galaxeae]MDC8003561.1 VOC family protein [Aureisphaera galaxeae]